MSNKRFRHIICVFFIIILAGCSSRLSQESLSKVTYIGSFSELQENPDQFADDIVLFGGKVLEINVTPTSSELMVLQMPIDNNNWPINPDQSEGRFLIRSKQFLDPAIYQKGTLLSIVGTVKGSQTRAIGGFDYLYPVLEAIEIKIWPKGDQRYPRVYFGFGIGTSF